MKTDFPNIEIPDGLYKIIGKPDEGTRCYYAEGSEEDAVTWFEAIHNYLGANLVSPGGVPTFAPVTRAGVHRRLKEGRLTAFFFRLTSMKSTFWGNKRKLNLSVYCLIPVEECKAWGGEIRKRGHELTTEQEELLRKQEPTVIDHWANTLYPWEKDDAYPDFLTEGDKGKRQIARQIYLKKRGKKIG